MIHPRLLYISCSVELERVGVGTPTHGSRGIYTITHNKLKKIHMCLCDSFFLSLQLLLDCYVLTLLNSNTVLAADGSGLGMTCL